MNRICLFCLPQRTDAVDLNPVVIKCLFLIISGIEQTWTIYRNSFPRHVFDLSSYKYFESKIVEGCPIHPNRVDSSMKFTIRLTWSRFENLVRSNRHESSPLLSIRKSGSRFARDLEFVAPLGFQGGFKMLRFDRIDTNRLPCCRFVIPEVDLRRTYNL